MQVRHTDGSCSHVLVIRRVGNADLDERLFVQTIQVLSGTGGGVAVVAVYLIRGFSMATLGALRF
jgi:hypothetical protein